MTFMRMTWRVVSALLVGSIITIWYLQNDTRFQQHSANLIKRQFSSMFGCIAEGEIVSLNFFDPEIIVKNPRVKARDGQWRWGASTLVYRFSWLEALRLRAIPGRVYVQGYTAESNVVNGSVALAEHIQRLAASIEGIPVTLKQVIIDKGLLSIRHSESGFECTCSFSAQVRAFHDRLKAHVTSQDGAVLIGSDKLVSNIMLQIHGEVPKIDGVVMRGGIAGSVDVCGVPYDEQRCYIKGTWYDQDGSAHIANKEHSIELDRLQLSLIPEKNDISFFVQAHMPLKHCMNIAQCMSSDIDVKGSCSMTASGLLFQQDQGIQGNISISDIGYQRYQLGNLDLTCSRSNGAWKGECNAYREHQPYARGVWAVYEADGSGYIDITSSTSFPAWPTRYWRVEPGDCSVKFSWRDDGIAYATFACDITHSKLGTKSSISGASMYKDRQLSVQGVHDQTSYMARGYVFPFLRLQHFRYHDAHGDQVISLEADSTLQELEASIEYPFIKALLDDYVGYRIPGKGKLKARGTIHPWGLSSHVWLEDAQIRLHDTYNFIRAGDLHITVDTDERKVLLQDCHLNLQQGSLHTKRATCFWDRSGIRFIHAPLLVDTVFLNVEKDLVAEISGSALAYTDGDDTVMRAHIVLDRGQLKRNIFSSIVQQSMTQQLLPGSDDGQEQSLVYDAHIVTKQPLHVKTDFLQTDAHIDIAVHGTSDEPDISGTIRLANGSLRFPYKPLYIHQGMIYFTPGRTNDPMIELHARGRVKRYSISMNVSGSIQNPLIRFESTPPLSEEQIITLLLAGSEEGSLRVVMPSLIMKNVQGLLFSSEQTPSKMQTYLNNILVPLRHVRLVPSFSDQTARGGFRWALEVDVSDRFHGVIQKNFSLSEDTRIEVEYLLSDDISVRGVKDERGDVGGEVEMRWKF